jgi:hypothetical protein
MLQMKITKTVSLVCNPVWTALWQESGDWPVIAGDQV